MRRKIEKFLSQEQDVPEGKIKYLEDGRFDFMGNFEGVLSAVRGKDTRSRKKGKRKAIAQKSLPNTSIPLEDTTNQPVLEMSLGSKENMATNLIPNIVIPSIGHRRPFDVLNSHSPQRPSGYGGPLPDISNARPKPTGGMYLLSPAFIMNTRSPHPSSFQSSVRPTSDISQTPAGMRNGLGDFFSPNNLGITITGMTPLSVSDNGGFKGFSPEMEINRNLFSCSKGTNNEEPSRLTLEVSVSPILKSPMNVPASKRRRYFTDQTLEGPVGSFDDATDPPVNVSLSQDSICLGIVPLRTSKAVTPGDKDEVEFGVSFDSDFEKSSEQMICTPDNPAQDFENNISKRYTRGSTHIF